MAKAPDGTLTSSEFSRMMQLDEILADPSDLISRRTVGVDKFARGVTRNSAATVPIGDDEHRRIIEGIRPLQSSVGCKRLSHEVGDLICGLCVEWRWGM